MEKINTLIHAEGMYYVFAKHYGKNVYVSETFNLDKVDEAVAYATTMAETIQDMGENARVYVATKIVRQIHTTKIDISKSAIVYEVDFETLRPRMTKKQMLENAYYHKSFDGTYAFDDMKVMCEFFKITGEALEKNFKKYSNQFFKKSGFLLYFNESEIEVTKEAS